MGDVVKLQRSTDTIHVYRDVPYQISYALDERPLYTWLFSLTPITGGVVNTIVHGTGRDIVEVHTRVKMRIDQALETWRGPDVGGPHDTNRN